MSRDNSHSFFLLRCPRPRPRHLAPLRSASLHPPSLRSGTAHRPNALRAAQQQQIFNKVFKTILLLVFSGIIGGIVYIVMTNNLLKQKNRLVNDHNNNIPKEVNNSNAGISKETINKKKKGRREIAWLTLKPSTCIMF